MKTNQKQSTDIMKASDFKVAIKNVTTSICDYGIAANYDVYIDGVKAFHVDDQANGSMYKYTVYNQELTTMFRNAVEALPEQMVFNCMMKLDVDLALALIHEAQEERNEL